MHERHVRECCQWLITSRTCFTSELPVNKANPASFWRFCRGDSGSPVPPGSSCTSSWSLGGLSSDPPILWDYVKMEGELIGQPWLLTATSGALLHSLWCVRGVLKLPTHRDPNLTQAFPEPFLSSHKTMASCVPQRKTEDFKPTEA